MIDLEERLRRAAELLDQEAVQLTLEPAVRSSRDSETRWLARVAATVVLVMGVAGVAFALSRTPGDGARSDAPPGATDVPTATTAPPADTAPATSAPDPAPIAPLATLPALADLTDVPVTVAASVPTDWYRLQPDLDVAWHSEPGSGGSMLCFRSPSLTVSCQSDEARPAEFGGGPIAIEGAAGQFLIVVVGDTESATVSVSLDDGSVVTGAIDTDSRTGWSVARVTVPPGLRPVGMWMSFLSTGVEGPGMSTSDTIAPQPTATPTSDPTPSVATTVPPPA